jgi:hypothetical protein
MTSNHRYNPVVSRMLSSLAERTNWDGMLAYLNGLSNSQFRVAGNILCDETLLQLDNGSFWACFSKIVPTTPKVYLVTFLKAAVKSYGQGRLQIDDAALRLLASLSGSAATAASRRERSLDEQKTLSMLLPVVRTVGEVWRLFSDFGVEDLHLQIDYLLPADTSVCSYALFLLLRKLDHEKEYLTEVCRRLMRRGGNRAFNLVSIIKCYFDLPEVHGQFSLSLKAYELSRLEKSYEEFKKVINSI